MVDTAIGIKYIYMAGSCDEETKPVVKQFVLGGIASCRTYNLPIRGATANLSQARPNILPQIFLIGCFL